MGHTEALLPIIDSFVCHYSGGPQRPQKRNFSHRQYFKFCTSNRVGEQLLYHRQSKWLRTFGIYTFRIVWDSFSWCRMRHEGRRISWYFSNGFLSDRLIIVAGKRSLANQPNKPRRSHPTLSPPFNYAFSSSMPFSASPFNLTINLSVFFCLEERERERGKKVICILLSMPLSWDVTFIPSSCWSV